MLAEQTARYHVPFLFIPGTIGSITWLARNEAAARRIVGGLVVACVGDRRAAHATSAAGAATRCIDRAAEYVLSRSDGARVRRLRAVGLGRAAVQLARLRPARRLPEPLARRRVRGVPLVRRRPRVRAAGALEDALRAVLEILDVLEADRPVREPRSQRGAAARPARALPGTGGPQRRTSSWRCSGCSTSPTASTRCSTSRSDPASPSCRAGGGGPARERRSGRRGRRLEVTSLRSATCVVSGATSGIGEAIVAALSPRGRMYGRSGVISSDSTRSRRASPGCCHASRSSIFRAVEAIERAAKDVAEGGSRRRSRP